MGNIDFYKFVALVTAIVVAVQLGEKAVFGAEKKRKKKNQLKAPVVYTNLPAGTALL